MTKSPRTLGRWAPWVVAIVALALFAELPMAQRAPRTFAGIHPREVVVDGAVRRFQIFVPAGYTPARKWPVILFLHGSGERGTDGVIQLRLGVGPYVEAHAKTFPAVVVFPQVPVTAEGHTTQATFQQADDIAMAALDHTLAEIRADSTRIYVTGLSMGAILTWQVLYSRPNFFAAAVPISGTVCGWCLTGDRGTTPVQADTLIVRRVRPLPAWLFHGSLDHAAPAVNDRTLVPILKAAHWQVRYTEYPGAPHDIWGRAYQDPELWRWLFAQHR